MEKLIIDLLEKAGMTNVELAYELDRKKQNVTELKKAKNVNVELLKGVMDKHSIKKISGEMYDCIVTIERN